MAICYINSRKLIHVLNSAFVIKEEFFSKKLHPSCDRGYPKVGEGESKILDANRQNSRYQDLEPICTIIYTLLFSKSFKEYLQYYLASSSILEILQMQMS